MRVTNVKYKYAPTGFLISAVLLSIYWGISQKLCHANKYVKCYQINRIYLKVVYFS